MSMRRPRPANTPRRPRIQIDVSESEKSAIDTFASMRGMTVSEWCLSIIKSQLSLDALSFQTATQEDINNTISAT